MGLLFTGFLLSLSLCLDLGTVNVSIIRTGIRGGSWPAFWVGLGSSVGDLIYAILSLAGISLLLQYVWIRWILWIGGSSILFYLSVKMIRETYKANDLAINGNSAEVKNSARSSFIQGMLLALSSPTAILWFAAVGGSIIATNHNQTTFSLFWFFSGFFLAGLLWAVFLSILTGWGRKVSGEKFIRIVSAISALLFLYFSAKVFLDGYHQFL